MRILIHLDNLRIGGAQHSAVDLAVGLAGRGHEVVLTAPPGPLEPVVQDRGVALDLVPSSGPTPSRHRAWALATSVGRFRADVVVAFGPIATMEAVAGAAAGRGVPVVGAYPSQVLPPDAPRTTAVVGRRDAVLAAARGRNPIVARVPAAVDTVHNHPGVDGSAFRAEHTNDGDALVVLVSRLSQEQKATGLALAIATAGVLSSRRAFRMVVVGDGGFRPGVEAERDRVGGGAVELAGELVDPRPAYAAADVVLGLGTSILRGMAHGRAAIVLGEQGAALAVEPSTVDLLAAEGWFAPGPAASPTDLADLIEALLDGPGRAESSAAAGREAVVAERDGSVVAALLEPTLVAAVERGAARPTAAVDAARSWAGWVLRRRLGRLQRRARHRLRQWSR